MQVLTYGCHIPSFGHIWAYNLALKVDGGYSSLAPDKIDRMLEQRLGTEVATGLGWCAPSLSYARVCGGDVWRWARCSGTRCLRGCFRWQV